MIVLILIIATFLAYHFFPKGNVIHEGLHLLTWWVKMWRLPTKNQKRTKISYGIHRRQYFILFEPLSRITQDNIIIYFHGGGWQFGSPEAFAVHAQFLTKLGYVVIMPSHRRIPFSDYFSMREDLNLIAKKALQVQQDRGWLAKNWIIGGMSSGGNLAALFALDREKLFENKFPVKKIKGLMLFGAPLELYNMYWSPNLYFFAGWYHSKKFQKANPINYLNADITFPILIVHGTKDGLVSYKSMMPFYKKFKKATSQSCQLITLEEGTHLNAASWTFEDCDFQEEIIIWLDWINRLFMNLRGQ